MASVNKVILVGNLGFDPETRTFPSGDQVCNVRIATTDKWKDKQSGEAREHTEWHRLTFNGRLAEIAAQYLKKGSQIYVEGSIRTRKYTDKDGAEKFATDIRVDQMQMLGSRQGMGGSGGSGGGDDDGAGYAPRAPALASRSGAPSGGSGRGNSAPAPAFDDRDDDIPF